MPGGTTSKALYWVYILLSLKDAKKYVGYTQDVSERLKQHWEGNVPSTRSRRPLQLIYLEGCLDQKDALRREKYFKTTDGRRFLAKRLKEYFAQPEE